MGSKEPMRGTGVWISMFRNCIHQIFIEFLQPFRDLRAQRFILFSLGFLFDWFWCFIGLGITMSPWCIINRCWHVHWRNLTLRLILLFSSLNFTFCRWRRWGGRRWWGMTLLSQRCLRSWWRSRGRTWQAWTTIWTKFSVLQIIRIPFSMRGGFWPLIHS